MRFTNRVTLLALVLALAAAVLGGCGGKGKGGNQPGTAGTVGARSEGGGNSVGSGAGADLPCPKEADVVAAVGAPVEKKPRGAATCYYETPDFETSVTIMSFAPGRADQLLEEMKSEAKPYGAEVAAIDFGERGYAWGSRGWGQGFVVAGGRGYMLDVTSIGGGGDTKAAVIKLLKLMHG